MFFWRKSRIFRFYYLWGVNVYLQIIVGFPLSWLFEKSNVFLGIFWCYDLWEGNISLQIIVDFLLLWLFWKSKSFSAGNCGFSAVKTCEKSISLYRKLCIFLLLWLIGKSNVSLQIIMDFLILWLFGKSNVSLKEIVDFNCTLRGLSTQADHHLLFVGSLFTLLRQLIDCPSSLPVEGELVYGKDRLLQSITSFMWGRVCQGWGKVMVRQGVYLMDFLLFWLMTYDLWEVKCLSAAKCGFSDF